MLTIILGIIVTIALAFLVIRIFSDVFYIDNFEHGLAVVCILLVFLSIVAGLTHPFSGYTDWEQVDEIELVSLSNSLGTEGSGFIYVSLSANNVYTYRYEVESEFGTSTSKEYDTNTISGNVTEIEDPNCTVPVFRIYERSGKKTVWTFALGTTEYSYVFYVPEGTIVKEVKLN